MKKFTLIYLSVLSCAVAATRVERVHNERAVAYEETLAPGESEAAVDRLPSVVVFLSDGTVSDAAGGQAAPVAVKRGQVIFRGANAAALRDSGKSELRFVRVEFPGQESGETWGERGFAPDYRLLVENGYVRCYNITIPAGLSEPQHTHRDRVVVCLSGAELRHVLPDGHQEDSSLKTGECLWRLGQTHVGKNIGKTDLWVIAVEPK
ncbi:MAG: hypothetical protein ABUL68_00365 [Pseudomonadota bacterium]